MLAQGLSPSSVKGFSSTEALSSGASGGCRKHEARIRCFTYLAEPIQPPRVLLQRPFRRESDWECPFMSET